MEAPPRDSRLERAPKPGPMPAESAGISAAGSADGSAAYSATDSDIDPGDPPPMPAAASSTEPAGDAVLAAGAESDCIERLLRGASPQPTENSKVRLDSPRTQHLSMMISSGGCHGAQRYRQRIDSEHADRSMAQ